MKKYNVKLLNKNFEKLPSDLKNTLNQPVIILSGKMASGKNYVCSLLEKFGYSSVDADILVHQAIDKAKNKILETFYESAGKENILILDQDGNINRRSLGKLLFTHPELLAKQEAIVYPIITQMIDDFIQEHPYSSYEFGYIVFDTIEGCMPELCTEWNDSLEKAMMDYVDNSNSIVSKYRRIVEVPFDSDRKMMSTVNSYDDGLRMFVKGSLESILNCCTSYIVGDKVLKLDKAKRDEFTSIEKDFSDEALRVIGFAYRNVLESDIDDDNMDLECNLIFVGMVGMIDPARDGVVESISMCKSAGIIPIMITGDSLSTALAISKNIGLCSSNSEGIEGKELSKYSDSDMVNLVRKYRVYARVSPSDKVRIVKAWQRNSKVVAMTGDGVNDAPAIKLAHIGIGMGQGGTEVTKSVADVLLLDDCFNTIVRAVREGRRIFSNIRGVILYSLSSNFAELFIVIIGMFLGINILLPIQILFIDLFTDAILSICMAFEKESPNVMKVPPHKSSGHFFTPFMTCFLGVSALIECVLIFIVYVIGYKFFGTVAAQSMAFLCLIVQEMVFAYNCRNLKETIVNHGLFSNKVMNIGI